MPSGGLVRRDGDAERVAAPPAFRREYFRSIRESAGFSVATLAATIGTSPRTLQFWESSPRSNPSSPLLVQVLFHLNRQRRDLGLPLVTIDELWEPCE